MLSHIYSQPHGHVVSHRNIYQPFRLAGVHVRTNIRVPADGGGRTVTQRRTLVGPTAVGRRTPPSHVDDTELASSTSALSRGNTSRFRHRTCQFYAGPQQRKHYVVTELASSVPPSAEVHHSVDNPELASSALALTEAISISLTTSNWLVRCRPSAEATSFLISL